MTTIAEDMRIALERGELHLVYLPTIRLSDGRCVGAEALARWHRKNRVLSGAEFIPSIENTPASGLLTYWVIDTVARELGDWLATVRAGHVSINVPPELLGRGGLEYAANHAGLSAHVDQVILEITERGIPDRLGLEALNAMADRGVRLALDDATLSGINIALLSRCNFGMLKIDSTLVAQIKPNKPPPPWLAQLASLLKHSTIQVVAEGLEHEHQIVTLRRAGIQFAQGFFYSRPLDASAFVRYHNRHS
jgi:sensor c-di-GMP phosphodiesterase-like protein